MTKNAWYTIEENTLIAQDVYQMRLAGPTDALTAPGQFVNIKLDGLYLRRPISVCSWDADGLTIIYKVVGTGTAQMATLLPGASLDLLVGLGNGFGPGLAFTAAAPQPGSAGQMGDPPVRPLPTVLVGGGVGVPPLYGLAQALVAHGNRPLVALGFRTAADVFYAAEFAALGCPVHVATEDGDATGLPAGILHSKGFVTGPLEKLDYAVYYACGPMPMLRAVHALGQSKQAAGQLSLEERMGCGFGACMGCACQTLLGTKRVCVDGPVFSADELQFGEA